VATVDLAAKGGAAATGATAARSAPVAAGAASLLAAQGPRVIYFDFDSFVIKDDFNPLIDGQARVLAANHSKHLVVEGHTDERGGREYNLALGQKRAEAVVRSLTLLGAVPAQVEAVSFGEERPAVQGSDESAWAKNRRAELKDR
jgi:peptidoglycan-associated lipoprotein